MVYNKESVDSKDLSTYEDLINEKLKGKILVRSSTSPYSRSLIAFVIANNSFEKAKEWICGIVNSMARKPSSGDTDQIYHVDAGEGDVAIVNSYSFVKILLSGHGNKRNVIDKLGVFFPNQNDSVIIVNISGAEVTKSAKNTKNAINLLEFLASKLKSYMLKNHKYPIVEGVETSEVLKSWEIYLQSDLPLSKLEENLLEAVMIEDECK